MMYSIGNIHFKREAIFDERRHLLSNNLNIVFITTLFSDVNPNVTPKFKCQFEPELKKHKTSEIQSLFDKTYEKNASRFGVSNKKFVHAIEVTKLTIDIANTLWSSTVLRKLYDKPKLKEIYDIFYKNIDQNLEIKLNDQDRVKIFCDDKRLEDLKKIYKDAFRSLNFINSPKKLHDYSEIYLKKDQFKLKRAYLHIIENFIKEKSRPYKN